MQISWDNIFVFVLPPFILLAYFSTLAPSIAGGDAGELVAEGCSLGTAHPPGYPLLTILVHVIKRVLDGGWSGVSVAYGVNAMSALFTTAATYIVGKSMNLIMASDSPTPGSVSGIVFGTGMFAFSPLIWQYAVTAEVFPLNTLFAAILVYLVILFSKKPSILIAYLGSFLSALAICNQHTIVLFEAPLILWMLLLLRRELIAHPRHIFVLSSLFLLGLSPYIYLPLTATLNPQPGSWGLVTTWRGFVHHVMRRDYGTFQLFSGESGKHTEGFLKRTLAYVSDLHSEQGFLVVPILAVFAVVVLIAQAISRSEVAMMPSSTKTEDNANNKKARRQGISVSRAPSGILVNSSELRFTSVVIIFTLIFYIGVFHSLANLPLGDKLLFGVHQRFWMQPNVIVFILAGLGYAYSVNTLGSILHYFYRSDAAALKNGRSAGAFSLSSALQGGSCIVAGCLVLLQFYKWRPVSDLSDAWYFRDYASAILAPLPDNAILLINYDQQWTSIRYMQRCEGLRTDVDVVHLSMMTYKWFSHKRKLYANISFPGTYHTAPNSAAITTDRAFTLFDFLKANIRGKKSRPVFLAGKANYPDPSIDDNFDYVPLGLVVQYVPRQLSPSPAIYRAASQSSLAQVVTHLSALPNVAKYSEFTWEWTIGRDFKDRITDSAAYVLDKGINAVDEVDTLLYAVYVIESAVMLESQPMSVPMHEAPPVQDGLVPFLAHLMQPRGIVYTDNSSDYTSEIKSDIRRVPTRLLKNAGLAHVHMVRHKLAGTSLPAPPDVLSTLKSIDWPPENTDWKHWCSEKFLLYWGNFVARSDAKEDPQYATIKGMYDNVMGAKMKIELQQNPGVIYSSSSGGDTGGMSEVESKKKKKRKKKKAIATD